MQGASITSLFRFYKHHGTPAFVFAPIALSTVTIHATWVQPSFETARLLAVENTTAEQNLGRALDLTARAPVCSVVH